MTQLLTLNILGLSLLSSRPSNLSPISWNTPCPILDPHILHTFSVKKFNQLHRKSARHCNNAPLIGQKNDEVWDLKASSIWELGNGSHHRIIPSSLGNSTQKPKIPQTRRDVHVTAIPTKGNFGVNDIPPHRPSSGKASERHRSEAGDLSYVGKVKRRQRQISYSQKGTFRLTDNLRKRVDLPALAHLWANETIGQSCVSFACKRVGQSPRPLQTCWPIISLSCVPKLFGQCSEATLSH